MIILWKAEINHQSRVNENITTCLETYTYMLMYNKQNKKNLLIKFFSCKPLHFLLNSYVLLFV